MFPRLHAPVVGLLLALGAAVIASSSDGRNADVFLQMADLLFEEGRYRDAADAYRRARDRADDPVYVRAATGLVRSQLRLADFPAGRGEAERLIERYPRHAEAITLHADTLWCAALFPEAEERYREALAIEASNARALHGEARALAANWQLERALEYAQRAVSVAPRDIELRHTLAFIYERLLRYEESAATLRDILNLLPAKEKSARAVMTRAQIRFLDAFAGKTPLLTDPAVDSATHVVPFKLVRDKIVVMGRVGSHRPSEFVVDTGAEMTVLGRRSAERGGVLPLGYTISAGVGEVGLRGLQVGRLDELTIGTYRVKNVPVLIKNPPLGNLPTREGDSISPLALGLSMKVDYRRRELTFGRHLELTGDIELPLYFYRLAMVRGTINDSRPATFVVDTGGEAISISIAAAGTLARQPARRIPLKVYGSSGWDRDAFLMPGVDLSFDRIRFENFATVVLNLQAPSALLGFEIGGIVGHRFLSGYTVGVDLERRRLMLTGSIPASASLPDAPPGARALPPPADALRPFPE